MPRKPQFGRIFRRKKRLLDGRQIELPTWWIAYYHDGKEERESSGSARYRRAEDLLKRRQSEIVQGTLASQGARRVLVSHLLDDLLRDFEINQKSLAWAKFVDGHLRPFFGSMKAVAVNSAAIDRYILKRRQESISNGTINRELGRLRRAFNLGREATPPKVIRVPRVPRLEENNVRKGFFEHSEFVALRAELPEHLRPVITFGYYTGCRKGEILALRSNQVDLLYRVIRLEPGETKNKEARSIPLIGELYEMLTLQRQIRDQLWPDCPWVFFRHGKRILDFQGAWEEASKRAGMIGEDGRPVRLFHDLRRTGVRNLIRAGVPERVAMMISGHKTRSMLDRYNVVSEQDIREAGWKLERFSERERQGDTDTLRSPEPETSAKTNDDARKLLV